jgi:DNA modification methylase
MNQLYYGDNLDILRNHIPDASVDLIYLDPPFNSNRSYNVLFKEASGQSADAQITAFDDSWHWNASAEETLRDIEQTAAPHVVEMMSAIVRFVGRNDVTAYLVMMCVRLIELHRVLKPTGSLYLHCDPTASHYLKVVMDTIFGAVCFGNEIIWKRAQTVKGNFGQGRKLWDNNTDTILFYRKSDSNTFNQAFLPYSDEYLRRFYKYVEEATGRRYRLISMIGPGGAAKGNPQYEVMGVTRYWRYSRATMQSLIEAGLVVQTRPGAVPVRKLYLDTGKGVAIQSLWDDIVSLGPQGKERLGYPTQKPLELLERIIQASSNEGDLVLDPFCGCGTTVCAAHKLGRQWIGIDITHLAVGLMRSRLHDMFGDAAKYEVIGVPADVHSAEALARQDRHEFEHWALGLIGARSAHDEKKGADRGMDGVIHFRDTAKGSAKKVVIQVKSGHVQSAYVRDLCHVVEREKAAMGFLISLERPTQPMLTEALGRGYYRSPGWNRDYAIIQIRTIEQLLNGEWFDYPQANITLAQAERVQGEANQGELF